MFNPIKKTDGEAKPINRLSSLRREEEAATKETTKDVNPPSQPNKSGAAFSKALNAVRQEVGEASSGSLPIVNKSSKPAVTFGDAINARREKTVNPFLKVSPQFQPTPEAKPEEE